MTTNIPSFKNILIFTIFTLIVSSLLFFNNIFASQSSSKNNDTLTAGTYQNCVFKKVYDWDTADFFCKKKVWSKTLTNSVIKINNLRFAWINAPDKSNWCYYKESTDVIVSKKSDWFIYTIQVLWKDLCKDKQLWCRPVWIITNQKTKKILNISMVENGFAFYWINDAFWLPNTFKEQLLNASSKASKAKNGLWKHCKVIYQEENLNLWDEEWAIPPVRTNFLK
jgi:endonuclease YncB( thermonuclease family)